ncbi:cytoskeleton-associated protein [Hirsutella rhossiliensis]|uniref:Cytoskeleton-associated protein n=1 Tax=Hirsutella rhossiliensis TaxID=111463 RepID=A0A9P8MY92_9HYPO|nr:cytoskeleton-associated protein [Hirsutella rhossiliensis]KAH0963172.1 cytoskeleton-associated protein [Hirsutella rhossiliensis]
MAWAPGLAAIARDERVVLLTIGLATYGLVRSIFAGLTVIRDLNVVPPAEPKTQYITQDTEDALQLETIEKLLNHPSYSIREVATKILCDRAINDSETTTHLLYGITRPDYDERMQCLRALALLTGQTMGLDGLSRLNNEMAYSALVRSLELSLHDVERPDLSNSHWDEYYLRDMAERFCLMFVFELVNKYGASLIIKAKFVEKWLAKQNWGSDPQQRRCRFKEYMDLKNNRLAEIVTGIKHSKRGLRALEKAGLIDKESSRRRSGELPELIMEIEEEIVGEQPTDPMARRTREHSAEERRLRRQHREAMVLNDGTRPLGREDIIERDHGSPA